MTRHYTYKDLNGYSFTSDCEQSLHSPRQSTIDAILQFAEIYPVNGMRSEGNLTYLYDLKN